jgi:TMEM175 potassium channel family protein
MRVRTFPKSRIDALTDGIFAFAMTLLVLELRLPSDAVIRDSAALIAQLRDLWPQYLAYLISFFVLAAQWRGRVELRRVEEVSQDVLARSMAYLFFITSVPFSTSVVGRYGDLPPAVWLYAANMIVVAALSLRLRAHEIVPEHRARARAGNARILVFMATAVVSVLISLAAPGYGMYAYLLNIPGMPLAARWQRGES